MVVDCCIVVRFRMEKRVVCVFLTSDVGYVVRHSRWKRIENDEGGRKE